MQKSWVVLVLLGVVLALYLTTIWRGTNLEMYKDSTLKTSIARAEHIHDTLLATQYHLNAVLDSLSRFDKRVDLHRKEADSVLIKTHYYQALRAKERALIEKELQARYNRITHIKQQLDSLFKR